MFKAHFQVIFKPFESQRGDVLAAVPLRPDHLENSIISPFHAESHRSHTHTHTVLSPIADSSVEKFCPVRSMPGQALLDFLDVFQRS